MGAIKPPLPKVIIDDFLDDEFVLDEGEEPVGPADIVFAAPSDAPPRHALPPPQPSTPDPVRPEPRALAPYAVIGLAFAAVCVVLVLVKPGAPGAGAARTAAESAIPAPAPLPPRVDAVQPALEPEPTVVISAPMPPAAPDPHAAEAKRAAQAALEKGRTAQAIEAGERSVDLDPTDAEAWLILGAAYDQRGTYAKARACFQRCVDEATHGPKGECAALLR